MIRRIELVNFMSHPHTVLEPAKGLTVLTGENNTGKSAVISALQILCRNISGDYMVRHGQRECRVVVETDEGNVLEWKRKSGTVSYTINGRQVHRLRGSVPEDLHDLLRLALVETEAEPFDVHFGEQKKPIFLLDESPARRATFFASSSDAIKLIEMQNRHRAKVRDARNEETRLVNEAARLQQRLSSLKPLDAIEEQVAGVEAEHASLQRLLRDISSLQNHISDMEQMDSRVRKHAETAAAAKSLVPPPEIPATEPLSVMIRQMAAQQKRIAAESAAAEAADRLLPPPELADTGHLSDLIARMGHLCLSIEKEEIGSAILDNCPEPPEILDIAGIDRHIDTLEKAQKTMENRGGELKEAEKRLAAAEAELRKFIETNNICPTCGQPMDADHILYQYHEGKGRS